MIVNGDTKAVKLTSTSVTSIIPAQTSNVAITEITVAEITGNATTFSMELYNGTTSYYLAAVKPLAARQVLQYEINPITGLVLRKGWLLRATAGNADRVDVTAVHTQP